MYRCDNFKTQLSFNGRVLASRLYQFQNETKHIDLRQEKNNKAKYEALELQQLSSLASEDLKMQVDKSEKIHKVENIHGSGGPYSKT